MKTAISLPDETYEQATRQAAELGISRSEFMARAARSYSASSPRTRSPGRSMRRCKAPRTAPTRPLPPPAAASWQAGRLVTSAGTIAAVITSSTALAAMPGNVFLPAVASGLPEDSVVNVTALVTLDKTDAVHLLRGLAEAREGAAQPADLEALATRFGVQEEKVKLAVTSTALEDLEAWPVTNPKVLSKIIRLIAETTRSPRSGTGKPERLKHVGGEVWSRRITEKDRLVYDIQSGTVTIIACRFRYDDH